MEKVIGNYIYNFNDYLGQGSYSKVYLGKVFTCKIGQTNRILSGNKNNRLTTTERPIQLRTF